MFVFYFWSLFWFFEGNVKFFNWLIVSSVPVFIIGVSEDLEWPEPF